VTIGTYRLRNLHSTQNSALCLTTERWALPSGTPHCTTHLNRITAHDLTAELPREGVGHCRTSRNGALFRQPTAPQLTEDIPAFYGRRRLSLRQPYEPSHALPSCFSAGTVGYATTNSFYQYNQNATTNTCYNESEGILSADVARACA